jgi:pimeloyl-ACP methyl ester carboxylesterase
MARGGAGFRREGGLNGDLLATERLIGRSHLASLVPRHHAPAAQVLLIHGACHGGWCWRFWQPGLAQAGFGAHAITLPNRPPAPSMAEADFRALRLAEYVAEVRDAAAALPGPVVLVGHSLGGIVAQVAAQSLDLAGLVLVASAGPSQLGPRRAPLHPEDRLVSYAPEVARARWFADADPAIADWAIARLTPESPGVLNGSGGGAVLDPALIRCPVLVMGAGRDASSVPPQDRLAALFGATLLHFPSAGHDLMLERGALIALRGLIGWLAATLPGG